MCFDDDGADQSLCAFILILNIHCKHRAAWPPQPLHVIRTIVVDRGMASTTLHAICTIVVDRGMFFILDSHHQSFTLPSQCRCGVRWEVRMHPPPPSPLPCPQLSKPFSAVVLLLYSGHGSIRITFKCSCARSQLRKRIICRGRKRVTTIIILVANITVTVAWHLLTNLVLIKSAARIRRPQIHVPLGDRLSN